MIAEPIELDPHTEGTSWQGIVTIGPITFVIDDAPAVPPSADLDKIWMQFRRGDKDGELLATFASDPDEGQLPITVVSAATWECTVPAVSPEDFPALPGFYHWAMKAKDADGIVYPLYEGVLEVVDSAAQILPEPEPDPAP